MIIIADKRINPDYIVSAEIETSHYMNGSRSWLVVKFQDGSQLREEHGWGFNAYDALVKIDSARAMHEATKTL